MTEAPTAPHFNDTDRIISHMTQVAAKGIKFTPLGLELPEDLKEGDWANLGHKLLRMDRICQWWIGDWAQFGAGSNSANGWRKHGALKAFCETNGIDYGTTRNAAWVSGSVHLSLRRDNVEYSFYQELAPLKPKDQKKWLATIVQEGIPRAELRRRIRISQGEDSALDSDGPILASGTRHYEELKAWIEGRNMDFWQPDRIQIWKVRLRKLVEAVPD